jgi:hypothetical protein
MALSPRSFGFAILIAGLAAVPLLSIDMSVPRWALSAPRSDYGLRGSL